MKKLMVFGLCFLLAGVCGAEIITVDDDGPADFSNIQAAINDSNDGDIIEVQPGTYTGNGNRDIDPNGKAITIRSIDPNDPGVVAATIIDCNGTEAEPHRGFYFQNDEGPNSVLSGLTIINGYGPDEEEFYGYSAGGGLCILSSPKIYNCLISQNSASGYGGGICISAGSSPIINQCVITNNSSENYGGGIYCQPDSNAVITHCTIVGNYGGHGGGINNLINTRASIVNHCIVWDNNSQYEGQHQITGAPVSYCDVDGGYSGEGNIDADPCFVDPENGDYRLSTASPCINTGNPNFNQTNLTDFEGQPRVINDRVDIGSDEFNGTGPVMDIWPKTIRFQAKQGGSDPESQVLSIHNLGSGSFSWQITENCSWLEVVPDGGNYIDEVVDVNIQVDISQMSWGDYNCVFTVTSDDAFSSPRNIAVMLTVNTDLFVPLEYPTIQEAIDAALGGDTIVVADGLYTGDGNRDINLGGKAISVRSEDGPANCIIDCQGSPGDPHRGFIFDSGEGPNSVVCGFTITGGYVTDSALGGGGAICVNASPKITNCIFRNNSALIGGGGLCYAYNSSPEVANCTFHNNSVEFGQGGAVGGRSRMEATMSNCIIWGNTPSNDSGISVQPVPYCSGPGCGPYPIAVNFSVLQNDWQSQQYINSYGSINCDPCFADPCNGDYHLRSEGWRWVGPEGNWTWDNVTSRCVDAGNPGSPLGDELLAIQRDPNNLYGHNLRINMGAYGGTAEASMPPYDWAILGDLTNGGKVDFDDLAGQLEDWLNSSSEQFGDLDRNGIIDMVDFALFGKDWLKQTTWYEP